MSGSKVDNADIEEIDQIFEYVAKQETVVLKRSLFNYQKEK